MTGPERTGHDMSGRLARLMAHCCSQRTWCTGVMLPVPVYSSCCDSYSHRHRHQHQHPDQAPVCASNGHASANGGCKALRCRGVTQAQPSCDESASLPEAQTRGAGKAEESWRRWRPGQSAAGRRRSPRKEWRTCGTDRGRTRSCPSLSRHHLVLAVPVVPVVPSAYTAVAWRRPGRVL